MKKLWAALGAKEPILSALALCNPRVENGEIVCNESYRHNCSDIIKKMSFLVLSIWKFCDFSDSRFTGQGKPMLGFAASLVIGTDIFVKKLIGDGCKKYYISPSLKAGPIQREFCIFFKGLKRR